MSFSEYLAGLDAGRLTALLEYRADVLMEPVPRGVGELALRLSGADSLARALRDLNRDELITARAVALLGPSTVSRLAARLRASDVVVRGVVDGLCARGLAWEADQQVGLPDRLVEHFAAGLSGFRPLALIARQARVDELRETVAGLGVDPTGLRKPELIERLDALLTDPDTVARAVEGLPVSARRHLDNVLQAGGYYYTGGVSRGPTDPVALLAKAGLFVTHPYGRPELPREVAVLLHFGARDTVTGRPRFPASTEDPTDGRAAAETALLAVTTLLDEARTRPLARLKKGGIGARERTRLATRFALTDPALWIDLAHAAEFLGSAAEGYVATAGYDGWREEEPGPRWSRLALAWWALELVPTSREIDDGEVAPPLPLESGGGMLRRALLRAAAGGHSVHAVALQVDWFCPMHPYDRAGRARKIAAAMHEATLLGVLVGDRLSALGELLVELAGHPEATEELGRRAAELLPATRGLLVLQSDLTAVVSGQPAAAAARLLAAAAASESRGVATTWRFTPASVRAALDAGWTANELRDELTAISGRDLPQPLAYLITDVARRHASVRVRGSRSCVTGTEPEITEILHTRSLHALQLSRLAPTVLTSPFELDVVLARLRKAGFSPMPEDADGMVIVAERKVGAVEAPRGRTRKSRERPRTCAADLAARLLASGTGSARPESVTRVRLAKLAPHLDVAEVALLADALDHGRDVRIRYRNKEGDRTVREIAPQELCGGWVSSWCHLRSGEREFAVVGIEAVGPAG
ncbi:MAG: helicase-associated domain-containing protein [Pseudonocardia sp.]